MPLFSATFCICDAAQIAATIRHIETTIGVYVKIAKPLLLASTPIGVAGGLYEAFQLAGGLAFIMFALVALIGAAMAMLVMTIRRESAEARAREAHDTPAGSTTS